MMDWLEKIFDIKKIPIKFIVLLWLVSSFLLFLPTALMSKLNLIEFTKEYGKYFGIAFLASTGFLLIIIFNWIVKLIKNASFSKKYTTIIIKSLNELDRNEKAVLREFVIKQQKTIKMPINDATVSGLLSKRIIHQVGNLGDMSFYGIVCNMSMTETANNNLLFSHIDLPDREPSQAEIETIREARPQWADEFDVRRNRFRF